ncbi:MAG: type II toxin-antitoxin system RelE/ParE family toxin [Pseudobdellovibrionaceae bacterium]
MEATTKTLINYKTEDGKEPFREWLKSLRDKVTTARIQSRLERVKLGNFGDAKSVGNGVSELRFTFGSGFRVYYAQDGDQIVVLLIGGDKSSQEKDIQLAHNYWSDYTRRTQDEKSE